MCDYIESILILFFSAKGFTGKVNLLSYLFQNIAARLRLCDLKGKEFKMVFKDVTFWIGALAGEVAYVQMYVKNVDEKAENFIPLSGNTVLDIGSNIGLYAIRNSKRVGNQGRIWAFEPNPSVFGRLLRNIKENGSSNIVAMKKAVSSESGRVRFTVASGISPEGKIEHGNESGKRSQETIEVDCITLDDFVDENRIGKIDLVKIDVEGEEFEVLKGAKVKALPLIEKIVLEYHSMVAKDNSTRFLKDNSFNVVFEDGKNRVLYFVRKRT